MQIDIKNTYERGSIMALIKCPECGKEISDQAEKCPNCGYPIYNSNRIQNPRNTYSNVTPPIPPSMNVCETKKKGIGLGMVSLILSFLGPLTIIGLILAIVNLRKKDSEDKKLSVIAIIVSIACIITIGAFQGSAPEEKPDAQQSQQQTYISESSEQEEPLVNESTEELSPIELFSQKMSDDCELVSYETAKNTYDFLQNELGFTNIEYVKNSSGTIFKINGDNYQLMVIVDDEKLRSVDCGTYKLYDGENILITKSGIEDRSIEDSSAYYTIAKDIVSSSLKSPSTAKYPSLAFNSNDIKMQRNKDIIAVKSYVDAQNSFGATIRSEWLVEFKIIDLSTFSYEVVYINIDGEKSGEFIELD